MVAPTNEYAFQINELQKITIGLALKFCCRTGAFFVSKLKPSA